MCRGGSHSDMQVGKYPRLPFSGHPSASYDAHPASLFATPRGVAGGTVIPQGRACKKTLEGNIRTPSIVSGLPSNSNDEESLVFLDNGGLARSKPAPFGFLPFHSPRS